MARPRLFSILKPPPSHKRHRIIILFTLGIALPSILLGGLAFRGIQNDRALLEKEALESSRSIAGEVIRQIDESIGAVEVAFAAAVTPADRERAGTGIAAADLEEFAAGHPLVEQLFVLRPSGAVDLPLAEFLYLPDRDQFPASPSSPASAAFGNAQRFEFREKDYSKALAAYGQALSLAGDAGSRGAILNAVARVQRKSGLFREAAATYEKLGHEYGRVVVSDGIPLGAAARLERAMILRDLGDGAGCASALRDLYESLLRPEWPLEKAQFDFFSGRVRAALGELIAEGRPGQDSDSVKNSFQRLEADERKKREKTERAIAFQKGAFSLLEAKLRANRKGAAASYSRLAMSISGYSYMVSIQNEIRGAETWGLILDAGRLREDVLRPALLQHVPSGEISWIVYDRDAGRVLASNLPPSGPVTVRADSVAGFPNWSLALYTRPPDFVGSFLGSRRGIYAYMFLLIAGILGFGLVLTIRTVSHELELARMKSNLVSTISHEFKSPLAAIRQLAEMLHAGRVPSEERRRKYYDILLEQSERLSLLTDNVLNLARIEEGRKEYRFEPSDLGALVRDVVSSVRERVRHEGFEIDLECASENPSGRIDRDGVVRALANLLDNAVKYSGGSRRVSVRLFVEDEEAVVAVRDSGIGIREEELDKVFQRFYRCGDKLTRTVGGTGLGLSLVKEIVEAHRGSVHVESERGRGSTFSIRLPLNRPEEG